MKKTLIASGAAVIVGGAFFLGGASKAPESVISPSPTPSEVSSTAGFSNEVNGVKMFNGKPVKFCFDHSKC